MLTDGYCRVRGLCHSHIKVCRWLQLVLVRVKGSRAAP
jgi:hypothetical protein